MGLKKITKEEFINRVNSTFGDRYDCTGVEFINMRTPIFLFDKEKQDYIRVIPNNLFRKFKSSERSGRVKKLTKKEFIERAKKIHGNKYDYSKVKYIDYETPVRIICPIHGEFQSTPNSLLMGRGCPTCGNINKKVKQTISEQVFNERMKKIYGDSLTYDFSNYSNFGEKMEFVCSKHGSFEALPLNVLHGHGCPICGREKCSKSRTMKFEEVLRRFKEVHGDTYTYDESTYKTSRKKMRIICPKHGEFWQIPMNHWGGQGCPVCKESKLEMELDKALTDNGIEFIRQKPLGRQSIDFYIPKYKINIECQGEQHFKKKFDDKYDFKKSLERDIKKNKILRENGEKLIYFTKENLLPNNIEDPMFCNIYNKDNLFYSTESIINILKWYK